MYLSPEPIRKVARGLEIGMICRDRLEQPDARAAGVQARARARSRSRRGAVGSSRSARAARSVERARRDGRAHARAAARARGRPDASTTTPSERRALVQRIAAATADKLGDPKGAFRWWRRAHDEAPDEHTLADVRRAGEAYGLWRELAEVLTDERKRLIAVAQPVASRPSPSASSRCRASSRDCAERRLGDKPRAIAVIAEALAVAPRDAQLARRARAARRRARSTASRGSALLDAYEVALAAASPARARRAVPAPRADPRRARQRSEGRGRRRAGRVLVGARSRGHARRRSWRSPPRRARGTRSSPSTRALDRARRTTPSGASSCCAARRSVIEEQLKDAPRAFRTHLVALLLAPEDADTASHLWRLARVIGKYREADATPQPEPPPATIQAEPRSPRPSRSSGRAVAGPPTRRRGSRSASQTEPLADADLRTTRVGDSTQPLDLTELEHRRPRRRQALVPAEKASSQAESSTMTLSAERSARTWSIPPRHAAPVPKTPPKPPPRPPQIARAPAARSPAAARAAQGAGRRAPAAAADAAEPRVRVAVGRARGRVREHAGARCRRRGCAGCIAPPRSGRPAARTSRARSMRSRVRSRRRAARRAATPRCVARLHRHRAGAQGVGPARRSLRGDGRGSRDRARRGRSADGGREHSRRAEAAARGRGAAAPDPRHAAERYGRRARRLEELYRAEGRWVELAASLEERTDPRLGTAAPEAERPQLLRELAGDLHRAAAAPARCDRRVRAAAHAGARRHRGAAAARRTSTARSADGRR